MTYFCVYIIAVLIISILLFCFFAHCFMKRALRAKGKTKIQGKFKLLKMFEFDFEAEHNSDKR